MIIWCQQNDKNQKWVAVTFHFKIMHCLCNNIVFIVIWCFWLFINVKPSKLKFLTIDLNLVGGFIVHLSKLFIPSSKLFLYEHLWSTIGIGCCPVGRFVSAIPFQLLIIELLEWSVLSLSFALPTFNGDNDIVINVLVMVLRLRKYVMNDNM